uniref:Uncharacterized protein n=1 Tax=viral metagenome TaxID=1070528 RepID=A0A6H2A3E0_9ZZZZ
MLAMGLTKQVFVWYGFCVRVGFIAILQSRVVDGAKGVVAEDYSTPIFANLSTTRYGIVPPVADHNI